jgi:cellulose synthase/poly-beta-1,6-N-acetylglucosamine synthase-like glycosyltransferase
MGLVFYSYALYPLVLTGIASLVQMVRDIKFAIGKPERRVLTPETLPTVAIVISAFNEERHIQARIENLLQMEYPAHLVQIFIGSDGSSDRTDEILAQYVDSRIKTFLFEQNRGKASVLNDLVAATTAPIIAFSDANTMFEPQALRRLVAHFSDQRVGAVSGELRLKGAAGDNQDSLYWRIEQYLKFFESRIGGLLGANGAIYAIRRELWVPLAADTICDDFCIAMSVAANGRKLVYEPAARAHEETPDAIADEYNRRVRIGIGNFQALVRHPEYLLRTTVGTAFAYFSHKVVRWVAPHLLILALACSFILAVNSLSWGLFAVLQGVAYLGAWGMYRMTCNGRPLPAGLRIPVFLFALNLAFLVASFRFMTGRYRGAWRRTSR